MFTGCKIDNPDIPDGQGTASDGTLQVTVSMPGGAPDTRISLEEADDGSGDVSLAWQEGDKIYLVFTQGEAKWKQIVELTEENIQNDNKKAVFSPELPEGLSEGTFNLYGVYGGDGFVGEDSYEITLPKPPPGTEHSPGYKVKM